MLTSRLPPFLLTMAHLVTRGQASATCYLMTGDRNKDKNVVPCNANATGTDGSHSACCHAGNSDACLSSGLCLNTIAEFQSHVLWASGCTDPTFKDPSCPQVCAGKDWESIGNYGLRSCNVTGNTWCCGYDKQSTEDCCKNPFSMTSSIGKVAMQLSPAAISSSAAPVPTSSVPGASPTASAIPSSCPTAPSPALTAPSCPEHSESGYIAGIAVTTVWAVLASAGLIVASLLLRRSKQRNKVLTPAPPGTSASTAAFGSHHVPYASSAAQQPPYAPPSDRWSPAPTSTTWAGYELSPGPVHLDMHKDMSELDNGRVTAELPGKH